MRPTLRQLQYIVVSAETGKLYEAAALLNVSQPSLSAQIADAETELGIKIFERGRTGVFVTPEGQEIVRRARIILTQVEDLKSAALRSVTGIAGDYRLGTLPSVGPYLLPKAVRALHKLYPDLRMSVREERTIDLEEKLHDGRLDMVISTAEDHKRSDSMPLFDEALFICAAHDDPLSKQEGAVALQELEGRIILSLGYGHRLSMIVQNLADAAGAHLSHQYEGTSLDAIRQMAGMGVGVAVLPSLYALMEAKRDPSQIIRPIDHPIAGRTISLIWRENSPLAPNIQQLGAVLRDVAGELLQG